MVVPLRVASWRPQVLLAKWIAAWRAASSQVEGAPNEVGVEAEAETVKAWKSIDQLS
jgi:hypothetical protein